MEISYLHMFYQHKDRKSYILSLTNLKIFVTELSSTWITKVIVRSYFAILYCTWLRDLLNPEVDFHLETKLVFFFFFPINSKTNVPTSFKV